MPGSRRSDRERSRHSRQHRIHSPVHSTVRSPDAKLDVVRRESPATSPRTRHMMSPGISAHTRHSTAYRSRSPDDYKKSRDDLVKWTIDSEYDTSQQQHSASMVLLLQLLLLFLVNQPAFPELLQLDQVPHMPQEREPLEIDWCWSRILQVGYLACRQPNSI